MNDAVSWNHYWTPLRYPLLFKVAHIFDDDIAKDAWKARLERNPARCAKCFRMSTGGFLATSIGCTMLVRVPEFDYATLPEVPPEYKPGDESAGPEFVDVTLWTAKRMREGKPVSNELKRLFSRQTRRGHTNEVSLAALDQRWRHLAFLPPTGPNNPVAPEIQAAIEEMERKRRVAVESLG